MTILYDPPSLEFPSDLTVGRVETRSGQVTTISGPSPPRIESYSVTMTVLSYDDVTVPAGTFRDAVGIRREDTFSGVTQVPIVLWYARGVGLIKLHLQGSTFRTDSVLRRYMAPD